MAGGGKRIGAGKPKGYKAPHTLESEEVRRIYIEMARKHGIPVAEALLTKALTGDVQAIKEFNDRAFGKAPQSVDLTSKGNEVQLSPDIKTLAQHLHELQRKGNSGGDGIVS